MTELFPSKAKSQSTTHTRYASLPDAEKIKSSYLFGLPLTSSLMGTTLSDETIESQVVSSTSWLEHTLDLYISPVDFEERHDWNLQHWNNNFGMIKTTHTNIINVNFVRIAFVNDPDLVHTMPIEIPKQMIYVEPKDGMIRIVPASNSTFSGWFYSVMGGYAMSLVLSKGRMPGAIWVNYTTGFEENKIPAIITDLIGIHASIEILSMLSAVLFPYASHSVSQDGLSHSTGSPGAQYLAGRIQQLQQRLDTLLDSAKRYYTKNMIMEWM